MIPSCHDPDCGWRIVITHNNNEKEEILCQESTYTINADSKDKKIYAEIIESTGISNVRVDPENSSFTANGAARVYNL